MPYLRFASPPLDVETKRRVAAALTAALRTVLRGRGTIPAIHFESIDAHDVAVAGQLTADGGPAPIFLTLDAGRLSARRARRLAQRIDDALAVALNLEGTERDRVRIRIESPGAGRIVLDHAPAGDPARPLIWLLAAAFAALAAGLAVRIALDDHADAPGADGPVDDPRSQQRPAPSYHGAVAASETSALSAGTTTPIVGEAIASGQVDVRRTAEPAVSDTHDLDH